MGKLTIQEIAKILVDKNKLTPKEANQFAAAMFEIIQQQLSHDELVKVKGLGTFKMIRVEPRESVSVRTGERVMIDSHAKVTFTPDATMKELVNKPFSHFETSDLSTKRRPASSSCDIPVRARSSDILFPALIRHPPFAVFRHYYITFFPDGKVTDC